jgi:hypothetical protein
LLTELPAIYKRFFFTLPVFASVSRMGKNKAEGRRQKAEISNKEKGKGQKLLLP